MDELKTMLVPPSGLLTASSRLISRPVPTVSTIPSNLESLQKTIQQTLPSDPIKIRHMEDLPSHLHNIHLVHLSNRSCLVLKASPTPITLLLRHERHLLENEALTLQVLARSKLPIARILKHDATCTRLPSPFMLTTCLPGVSCDDAQRYLTRSERISIERQLRSLITVISQHTSSMFGPFGPVSLVASNQGHRTWREAFAAMVESVLMDGEDVLVILPYQQIRDEIVRCGGTLDSVKDPRLVVLGLCEPQNVLIDRRTNEITGILDFGRALWGDWEMGSMEGASGTKGLL